MTSDLAPGQVIADKYRVEQVLGEGGMGYVVAAHHLKLDQRVALKFLKPDALKHPHVVQRFAREARAAAKIRGEHVARVIDVGDLPSGAPYIVMEYLEGEDLGQRLQQRGPLQVEEAVGYLLQACEALAEAHTAGIVHRDLKPPNLFLARTAGRIPTVKVLDFGISKALDEAAEGGRHLTSTSMIMGTPHYMSPEQLRSSRDVDARSDIWALGVVLFELLTGHPPFDGENATAVITSIITDEPRSLLALRSDAPSGLWAVLLRCLAKQRSDRFANVLELARALMPFSGDRARDSLARIESIVRPLASNAPPPDTQASASAMPATQVDAGTPLSVDVSVPLPSTERVAVATARTLGSQQTVRSADFPSADARSALPAETRANWDATLPAAAVARAPRRVGLWLAAGAVTVALVGYGVASALSRPRDALGAGAPAPGLVDVARPVAAEPPVSASAAGTPASAAPPLAPLASETSEPRPATSAVSAAPSVLATAPRSPSRSGKSSKSVAAASRDATEKIPVAPTPAGAASSGGSLRMGIK